MFFFVQNLLLELNLFCDIETHTQFEWKIGKRWQTFSRNLLIFINFNNVYCNEFSKSRHISPLLLSRVCHVCSMLEDPPGNLIKVAYKLHSTSPLCVLSSVIEVGMLGAGVDVI